VEGSKKALLIDTGTGVADLKTYVESITKLPVIVVNTHGHPDHCGSNYLIDTVYAEPVDFEMIKYFNSSEYRKGNLENAGKEFPEFKQNILNDAENTKCAYLEAVEEGYVFDLGDRELNVIAVGTI
jgi:glyoxylase-like metal-dependent hydrolase (beta-lactamase superfamily II)